VKFIEPVNDPRAVNQDKKNILFSVRITFVYKQCELSHYCAKEMVESFAS